MTSRLLFLVLVLAAAFRPAARAELRFEPAAEGWGLDFRHRHGGCGEFYMIETMGSGVVIFDYDGDGDQDVFFVDSGRVEGCEGEPSRSELMRNDGGGRFADVTTRSGIVVTGYGMGATAGDVDGDGDLDLYVTSFGANQLFTNDGDGTFTDVTATAGVEEPSWSASAAFADADGDGDLDLYVTNYLDFSYDHNPVCGPGQDSRSYCHPNVYDGLPDRFYLNRSSGGRIRFVDATRAAGFADASGKGLGVVWSDLDGDGRNDVYVANDMTFNFQFRNLGPGEDGHVGFEEIALLMGTAVGDHGQPEAGMGIGVTDLDGDSYAEIFVTHLDRQTNALYGNQGGLFTDRRFESGLAEKSLFKVGFGAAFADFDLDGDPDLAVANGHIIHNIAEFGTGTTYAQQNQLFENTGRGRFREVTGAGLEAVRVSRGLAVGDLDGDADLDLVISNSDGVAEVYRNVSSRGPWLRLDLDVAGGNRQGVGARIELRTAGSVRIEEVRTASSYLSQNEMTLHFGLGEQPSGGELILRLAGRPAFRLRNLPPDRRLRLGLRD